jgi:putative membrane protein
VDPYAWSWNVEALILVPGVTAAYLYALRQFPAPRWRIGCFLLAGVLILAVTITPVETLALHYSLSLHLLQNVVLAEWAPLLAVLGLPPALAAVLPVPRTLVQPWVAVPLWVVNYIVWHLPWVYDEALQRQHSLLHLEHLCYFVTGVLLWWAIFHEHPVRLSPGAKAITILAGFVFAAPIGLMLTFLPDPIYDYYVDAPRLWGLTALEDQQIAGVTMAAEQSIVFFVVFILCAARFLAEQETDPHDALPERPAGE